MIGADFALHASVLVLVRATVLLAAATVAAALMGRRATRRSTIWSGAAICLLVLPVLTFMLPERQVTILEPIAGQLDAVARASGRYERWPTAAVVVWLSGALVVLARLCLAIVASRRLVAGGRQTDVALVNDVLVSVCASARLRAQPRVALSDVITVPVTTGVLEPVVLLPADAIDWSGERLDAVLRHEIAHIARRDYATRIAFEVASAIYWPNPLVWYAAARARIDQERVADDFVLEGGASPPNYASLLVALARSAGRKTTALAATTPPLKTRVASILDGRRRERTLETRAASIVVFAAVILSPIVATLSLAEAPRVTVTLPARVVTVLRATTFFNADEDSLLNAVYYGDRQAERLAAARVLRRTRRNGSAASFLAHLEDTCSSDRWRAARALRELADVRALEPLMATMRSDRSEAVRNMAADAVDVLRYVRDRAGR